MKGGFPKGPFFRKHRNLLGSSVFSVFFIV